MGALLWDQTGEKLYETGVDQGVLFPQAKDGTYPTGVAWNGLSNVDESPSGAEASPIYADNQKYLNLISAEDFGATIEAYMYPEEWEECDGSKEIAPGVYAGQQNRRTFGFVYRTLIGNDIDGTDYGYKLHLVYNGIAAPSSKSRSTVNESPEAATMSWEVKTTPVKAAGMKATAHIVINSTKFNTVTLKANLKELEKALFGYTPASDQEVEIMPYLPLPADVIALATGTKTAADLMPSQG